MSYSIEDVPYRKDAEDESVTELEWCIVDALKSVYDPEIPVDIYELGLIYALSITGENPCKVCVDMTLTAPGCPVAGSMPEWVKNAVENIEAVEECQVNMVWDPPWRVDMMSLRAKIELNMI